MMRLNSILRKSRVLFIIDDCPYCRAWKQFIQRVNFQVKPEKRIRIVDATYFNLFGIDDNPITRMFSKYLDGFPTLFFEGRKIESTSTKIEAEAYIRAALHDDFILPANNRFITNDNCRFVKRGIFGKKTVVCS